jgi:signal transduction histidine kinase
MSSAETRGPRDRAEATRLPASSLDVGQVLDRLRQNETLLEVARAASSSLDFAEILRRVARTTGRALGADMVGAYLADADGSVLRPVAGYHVPRELLQRFLEFGLVISRNAYVAEGWRMQQHAWCADALSDGRSDPALTAWAPLRSVLFFPLVAKDRPIGALFLIWWAPRPEPTPAELQLLEGIARQTALAVGNAQLFDARVRDAQRLQALNDVSRSLAAILDPREVVDTIARFAAELVDARLVRLWLLDDARGDLALVASGGDDAAAAAAVTPRTRIAPGAGLVGTIFASRQAEFIRDIAADPRWLNPALSERLGLHGFAGVPLVLKDDVIGVLSIMTRRAGEFTDGQRRVVEAFTSQAALALHNARAFDEQQRRLRETEALLGVADSLGHTRDVGEIMRRVCREAARALGADCAVFYIVDEANAQVVPAAGYHIPKDALAAAAPLRVDEIPAAMVESRQARRILFVADVANDDRFGLPALRNLGARSFLLAPVVAQDRFLGDVVLCWRTEVHEVSEGDLALMAAIGHQAALALENARLLAETQSQAAALREKNAELDSFVYTVSHDLKAPLVTIQGMSGIVLEEYTDKLDDDGRHYLERIVVNTQQMERLILDLLALSRSGREGRPPEDVHLSELVDECLGALAEQLQAKAIKVTVGDLPTVWAVRVQMEQVLKNLLTNAIKYMGDTASPAIEIGAIARPTETEIWVRDTGIGIDPAYHDKVFEIFQRLKEVEAEGTGVGLPIVKKIVHAAGGRIWVESAPGQGSTFRFTWPVGARR